MRRKVPEKLYKKSDYYSINIVKPWFWKKCHICGDEVKREKIHCISIIWTEKCCGPDSGCVIKTYGRGETDIFYFCNNCCPTLTDVQKYFETELFPLYYPYWRENESS